ncbi:HXXXD-type acyl-transferase family protein [Carex rostrata]
MEVQILERISIFPSPPPSLPSLPLPLSHLDTDRNLHVTFRTLRLYSKSPDKDPFQAISPDAVSAALSLFFPLTGSLHCRQPDSRLEIQCTASDSIPLIRAVTQVRLSEVLSWRPDSTFLNQLSPYLDQTNKLDITKPLLALQITQFSCGGFAFGMCVHHALCDGAGANQFLASIARFARGEGPPVIQPLWERAELLGPRNPPHVNVPFDRTITIDADVVEHGTYWKHQKSDGGCRLVKEWFDVSDKCVEQFRDQLKEEAGFGVNFTTFEVLSAFIWRARIKASQQNTDEVVKMVYSMNISKILNPPLPAGYWGNVCVPVYVTLTAHELTTQPLWKTTALIRDSKRCINDEYVRSYIDFQELHFAKGISAGARVSAFTDWRRLGHSEVDFGWGPPVSVMPLSWKLLGSVEPCFFLPHNPLEDRKEKNGFKILVCLDEKSLESFKKEMQIFSE